MKKIGILLFAILLCVSACVPVFADMGGPEFIGYTAAVKTDAPYYNWEWDEAQDENYFVQVGTIPAGTELQISNEYDYDGVMYAYFYGSANNDVHGYVRIADLYAAGHDSAYPAESGYKQDDVVRLRVVKPDGLVLYAGPSATYAEVVTVPRGTELTVDTLDQDGYGFSSWMYVVYKGKSGWANCFLYDGAYCSMAELLPQGKTGVVWVVKDNAALQDADGNDIIAVPKGEKLTFDAFNRGPHDYYFHVTYQGKSGFFCSNDDGFDNVAASSADDWDFRNLRVSKTYAPQLYAYPDDAQPIGTLTYQAGETLQGQYIYYAEAPEDTRGGTEWLYVEKDGQSGWVKYSWDYLVRSQTEEGGDAMSLYVADVPEAAEAAAETDSTAPQTEESTAEPDALLLSASAEPETGALTAASGRSLSPTGIIGVCIAAAAVLALTAFVTLRLIRKKQENREGPAE